MQCGVAYQMLAALGPSLGDLVAEANAELSGQLDRFVPNLPSGDRCGRVSPESKDGGSWPASSGIAHDFNNLLTGIILGSLEQSCNAGFATGPLREIDRYEPWP